MADIFTTSLFLNPRSFATCISLKEKLKNLPFRKFNWVKIFRTLAISKIRGLGYLKTEKMKPKKRYFLSKKEIKSLEKSLSKFRIFEVLIDNIRERKVEQAVYENLSILIIDKKPCIIIKNDLIFPSLQCLLSLDKRTYPGVIIDRGATLALLRGADLMAPGVRKVVLKFDKDDIIVALDEELNKPIAILKSLKSSDEIEKLIENKGKGKVAKNLHHINDMIWKMF